MIKVFLSHQRADSLVATEIAQRLVRYHGIESYLDVIDPYLGGRGENLARHIRTEMGKCTQLMAVVSYASKESQWVPWEVGVVTEKNFPLATFANYTSAVPEFLQAWPYLRTMDDVDKYAVASKGARSVYVQKRATLNETAAAQSGSDVFFSNLRASLRQG